MWFIIVSFATGIIIAVIAAVNIYYFNRIRTSQAAAGISTTEATTLLWVNVVLLVFGVLLIILAIVEFFRHQGLARIPTKKESPGEKYTQFHMVPVQVTGRPEVPPSPVTVVHTTTVPQTAGQPTTQITTTQPIQTLYPTRT